MSITIHRPDLITHIQIWFPKYSSQYGDTGEKVALLAKYKVDQASPVFIVEFTKAKHLAGQRFAISREKAQSFPLGTNSKIDCYEVPLSAFHTWNTPSEVNDIAMEAFDD